MSDFVGSEPLEVEVLGRKFKLREMTGSEFDKMTEKYVTLKEDGAVNINIEIRNAEALKLVVDAPYDVSGVKFADLSQDVRLGLLQKLKPLLRNKLIAAINKSMGVEDETKNE